MFGHQRIWKCFAPEQFKASSRLQTCQLCTTQGRYELTLKAGRGGRSGHVEPLGGLGEGVAVSSLGSDFDVADDRSNDVGVEDLGTAGSGKHD